MKFEVGKTYTVRSLGDWDCVWQFTVVKRTAKFITIIEKRVAGGTLLDGPKRVKIRQSYSEDGAEWAMPLGQHSMCPIMKADRVAEPVGLSNPVLGPVR